MVIRRAAWKKARAVAEASSVRQKHSSSKSSTTASAAAQSFRVASPKDEISKEYLKEHYASISKKAQQKISQDREFYVSILESTSATKRDAKLYLQKFGPTVSKNPQPALKEETAPTSATPIQAIGSISIDHPLTNGTRAISEAPRFVQGPTGGRPPVDIIPSVAVIKFRRPQDVDDAILKGVGKTIAQFRAIGLLPVIVLDCELSPDDEQRFRCLDQQVYRLASAIDDWGPPWTAILKPAFSTQAQRLPSYLDFTPNIILVDEGNPLLSPLLKGSAVIVTPVLVPEATKYRLVDPNRAVLSITRYLSGMQPANPSENGGADAENLDPPTKKAFVDRVIILDPLGGIPAKNRWNNAHLFLNLEDELESAKAHLRTMNLDSRHFGEEAGSSSVQSHLNNLDLAKSTLSILPSTASALITTPKEAANLQSRPEDAYGGNPMGFVGTVGTRRILNPLIHNLFTDRPLYSSSLPLGRIRPISWTADPASNPVMSCTTLAKKGMPVRIYPDPGSAGWTPPKPGTPRLRLTDKCIDLPRLIHLIEDSFNRELDVQHYLDRVEQSLAGIIIAGEYEGGAILTWERPFGMDEKTAYESGRLVPYLDKFAVLKKSQGAGGVADIVFNAMVRDCLPESVCWRSRKNNPVNKWYFERSRGTKKLPGSDWTMFWTTRGLTLKEEKLMDYEDVCRNIAPSLARQKQVVD